MLFSRIITAIVLVSFFVTVLFTVSSDYFNLCVAAVILMAGWEWSSLSELTSMRARCLYQALLISAMVTVAFYAGIIFGSPALVNIDIFLFWFFSVSIIFWLLAFLLVITHPRLSVIMHSRYFRLLIGLLVLTSAWLGLSFLRNHSEGIFWVLYVVAVVASADIGAYFFGKQFGKTKLASQVSPGKSWEGLVGGLLLSQLLVLLMVGINAQVHFMALPNVQTLLLVTFLIATVSALGDLFESILKRIAGIKDSGTILPGHGGVLDRIDGLTSAVPIFSFVFLLLAW